MKKRNVQLVHEHFEEVLTPLYDFKLFIEWSHFLMWQIYDFR